MPDPRALTGQSYRQTVVESDGQVMQSKWLPAERVALWLHAILGQGRRVRGTILERGEPGNIIYEGRGDG